MRGLTTAGFTLATALLRILQIALIIQAAQCLMPRTLLVQAP